MKKIISVLFVLLSICCVITSCKDPAPQTPAESDAEQPEAPVILAENGQFKYTLIRPELVDGEFSSAISKLFSDIQSKTQSTLVYTDDWIEDPEEYNGDAPEILVGFTNRPESLEVLQNTPADSYTVKHVNNKIVIAAHTVDNYVKAFEAFVNDGIKAEADSVYTFEGEYKGEGNTALLFDTVDTLKEYQVVYRGDDNKGFAQKLVTRIKNSYGVNLECVDDSAAPQDKEIVLGSTNRFTDLLDVSNGEYQVIVDGSKIFITANMDLVLDDVCDTFTNDFITSGCSFVPGIPKELNDTFNLYNGGEDTSFADGTDVRIMSWNVLFQIGSGSPIPGRENRVCATILAFQPDVIGLQEATPQWYQELQEGIGYKYSFIFKKNTRGGNNYTGIAYNKETVKVVKQDMIFFSVGNSTSLRIACWGLFERLEDGKQFIVVNTHWEHNDDDRRLIQSQEEAALVNQLVDTYKVPVFATGDFNSKEDGIPFTNFMNTTGMQDAKYDSKVIKRQTITYHGLNSPIPSSKLSVDHITATKDVELLYYNTLIDNFVIKASDHCPIYVDVKLK